MIRVWCAKLWLALSLVTAGAGGACADSDSDADTRAVEALFVRYIEAWNARDFATIAGKVYRTPVQVFEPGATGTLATPQDIVNLLSAVRADLDAGGFSHSELERVSSCDLGDGLMFVSFHYRRFSFGVSASTVLSSAYVARRYADGWRLVAHVFQSRLAEVRCEAGQIEP